ncbi:hypothetical protein ZWY2020_016819 [Hordeum vulgare]|nr:hypothetical protein ZWY2020_016819 [Hordeum vulgare]
MRAVGRKMRGWNPARTVTGGGSSGASEVAVDAEGGVGPSTGPESGANRAQVKAVNEDHGRELGRKSMPLESPGHEGAGLLGEMREGAKETPDPVEMNEGLAGA